MLGVGSEEAALEEASGEDAAEDADAEALASAELEALGAALADDETAAESVALGTAALRRMAVDEDAAAEPLADDDGAAESVADDEAAAESLAEGVAEALAESADDDAASELDCGGAPEIVMAEDPDSGRMVIAGEADAVGASPGAEPVALAESDEAVAEGPVVSVVAPEALEMGGAPGLSPALTCTVHLVTFSKASPPAASLMGVKVISQVSIKVPAAVTVSFVVVSDVWLPGACRASKGRALAWAESKNKRVKRARNEGLVGRMIADNIVRAKCNAKIPVLRMNDPAFKDWRMLKGCQRQKREKEEKKKNVSVRKQDRKSVV